MMLGLGIRIYFACKSEQVFYDIDAFHLRL
jgi:hypothetical protein